MRLIDTHCHIQFDAYDADRDEVISKCNEKEIGLMVVGCEEKSSRDAIALVERIGDGAWCSVGQHPTDSGEEFDYATYRDLAQQSKKVRAIGECGLDYYHLPEQETERAVQKDVQKGLFAFHIDLAHEMGLPLIIHCRDAHDDMIEILIHRFGIMGSGSVSRRESVPDPIIRELGVMHCFTGTARDAQSYLDLGFLISFTGIVTFTHQYDDVVHAVPLDKMMIETDAPFLTPVPNRGKRNSPEYVEFVCRRIAEIRGISFEEIARVTTDNARRLFGL
ncbi:MAG: TatD family hydrolase [Patescibacteria group bacterium]